MPVRMFGSTYETAGSEPDLGVGVELIDRLDPARVLLHDVGDHVEGGDVGGVARPADAVRVEPVEDGPVGRDPGDRRGVGGDQPEGGAGQQEAAIRVRLGQHRAEVAVAEGERAGQRVVEGDLLARVVRHRPVAAALGPDEPVVAAVRVLQVAGVPALGDVAGLAGIRLVEGADVAARRVRVRVRRAAAAVEGEPVTSAEHPEVVVEGMVLLHHDHDVVDLGQRVGALGQARVRAAIRGGATWSVGGRCSCEDERRSCGARSPAPTPTAAAPTPSAP